MTICVADPRETFTHNTIVSVLGLITGNPSNAASVTVSAAVSVPRYAVFSVWASNGNTHNQRVNTMAAHLFLSIYISSYFLALTIFDGSISWPCLVIVLTLFFVDLLASFFSPPCWSVSYAGNSSILSSVAERKS